MMAELAFSRSSYYNVHSTAPTRPRCYIELHTRWNIDTVSSQYYIKALKHQFQQSVLCCRPLFRQSRHADSSVRKGESDTCRPIWSTYLSSRASARDRAVVEPVDRFLQSIAQKLVRSLQS